MEGYKTDRFIRGLRRIFRFSFDTKSLKNVNIDELVVYVLQLERHQLEQQLQGSNTDNNKH